jgi:peroxiredoxin
MRPPRLKGIWLICQSISCAFVTTLFCAFLFLPGCEKKAEDEVLKVGDKAPKFETYDMNHNVVSSEKALGKPMILRFFDPHCKYCRADTVIFNNYYSRYKDQGLQVVYLNTEPQPKETEKFIEELQIKFPVVLDTDRKVANLFRVQVVPQTIILDPQHIIIGAILGGVSEAELDDMLSRFFK